LTGKKNILLYPFSLLYGLITSVRNFLYNSGTLKGREFDIPVICVGNITVGGTGKTPHSEYLIRLLSESYRVALLSRGYKRNTKGFRIAGPDDNSSTIGDEPFQVHRKYPDITVAVCANRAEGIDEIIEKAPETEVIILDDGFQHRKVKPGLSILLTDYSRLMIHDHIMPYGELRESVSNMYRSDIILVTKSPLALSPMQRRIIVKDFNKAAYQDLFFTSYDYVDLKPVFPGNDRIKVSDLNTETPEKLNVLLVTGIANPTPLAEHIERNYKLAGHLRFPDHHRFRNSDIASIILQFNEIKSRYKAIITTEKDAARLQEFSTFAELPVSLMFYIPVNIVFLNDDRENFDKIVLGYVRKNSRNNRIPKEKRI
jgi:tetraacyldisaccharide 4'-kinase